MRLSLRSVYLLRTRQHGVARVASRAVLQRMRRTRRGRLAGHPPIPNARARPRRDGCRSGGQRLGSSSSAGERVLRQSSSELPHRSCACACAVRATRCHLRLCDRHGEDVATQAAPLLRHPWQRLPRLGIDRSCGELVLPVFLGHVRSGLTAAPLFDAFLCCQGCGESGKGTLERAVRIPHRCRYRLRDILILCYAPIFGLVSGHGVRCLISHRAAPVASLAPSRRPKAAAMRLGLPLRSNIIARRPVLAGSVMDASGSTSRGRLAGLLGWFLGPPSSPGWRVDRPVRGDA
jgi:hypothetical protein